MKLSDETIKQLQAGLEGAAETGGIPGTTAVVFDKDGEELFVHSAGKRGVSSSEPMTPDNIYWIASCTKMLTGLSCMQLVEKGSLGLDDSDQLEKLCPELRDVQVLKEDGTLEPKRNRITLRMLLTHTAGFGYAFFSERLRDYGFPAGIDEFSGSFADLKTPLLFHPGEGWQYGVGVDWAGIALERATGMTLNEYMQKNICEPLGLKNMNMIPTPEMKAKLAHMHQRLPSGEVIGRDHLLRRPLIISTDAEKKDLFCSGGAGMFAKPQEYCRVLAALLNNGTCPKSGVQLLGKSTVDEMFKNQIPQFPQFGRQNIPPSKPDLTNPIPDIYPTEGNSPQGWGLTFMLTGGATGRSEGTAFWAGLANLFWWVDRENGVGGMICSQLLPFGDQAVLGAWIGMEATVYQALKSA